MTDPADRMKATGTPKPGGIRPPLALSDSVLDVTDGFSTDDEGRIIPTRFVRACENHLHVFASVDGPCQCGKNRWPGAVT